MGKYERKGHLKDLNTVGLTVLEWDVMKGSGSTSVVFIQLSTDTWRAVVYTVMNHQVPQNGGNFLTNVAILSSFSRRNLILQESLRVH